MKRFIIQLTWFSICTEMPSESLSKTAPVQATYLSDRQMRPFIHGYKGDTVFSNASIPEKMLEVIFKPQ